jgi:DNA polymerase-3 subunit epsilon
MYAIVDIETTGGIPSNSGITELAIIFHDGIKETGYYHTMINPQHPIPPFITSLTGITNAMVASAPLFDELAPIIHAHLKDRIFVAHNVSFDYSFLQHHLRICGFEMGVQKLCTVSMSRKTFPGLPSYSLGKLCKSLDIALENRHRALGDAKATGLLFEKLMMNGVQKHIDAQLHRYRYNRFN